MKVLWSECPYLCVVGPVLLLILCPQPWRTPHWLLEIDILSRLMDETILNVDGIIWLFGWKFGEWLFLLVGLWVEGRE